MSDFTRELKKELEGDDAIVVLACPPARLMKKWDQKSWSFLFDFVGRLAVTADDVGDLTCRLGYCPDARWAHCVRKALFYNPKTDPFLDAGAYGKLLENAVRVDDVAHAVEIRDRFTARWKTWNNQRHRVMFDARVRSIEMWNAIFPENKECISRDSLAAAVRSIDPEVPRFVMENAEKIDSNIPSSCYLGVPYTISGLELHRKFCSDETVGRGYITSFIHMRRMDMIKEVTKEATVSHSDVGLAARLGYVRGARYLLTRCDPEPSEEETCQVMERAVEVREMSRGSRMS